MSGKLASDQAGETALRIVSRRPQAQPAPMYRTCGACGVEFFGYDFCVDCRREIDVCVAVARHLELAAREREQLVRGRTARLRRRRIQWRRVRKWAADAVYVMGCWAMTAGFVYGTRVWWLEWGAMIRAWFVGE